MQSMFQNKQRLVIISSFLAVVTGILVHFAWNHYQQEGRDRVNLIIGILSARHNFKEREIIRKSWLKRTKLNTSSRELNWVAFFVIGNRDCLVPESDRVSPFSCSRVNITSQDLESSYSSSLTTSNTGKTNCNPVVGLSFQVNSDILLTGVKCITRVNGKACKSIELLDVKTRETIIKQPVIQDNTKQYNETTNSLSSLSLKPSLLLPKTFTGLIVSHYEEENDDGHHLCTETSLDVNEYFNNTGLISLLKVYRDDPVLDDFLADSFQRNQHHSYLISFDFQAADRRETSQFLMKYEERTRKLEKHHFRMNQILAKEMEEHRDIVIVDVLDVYRSLPLKVLKFLEWSSRLYDFQFLLKTDDDCFLDIDLISHSLRDNDVDERSWWGNFRRMWPVDQYGKWAELDYDSATYPPFACGSGYVLGNHLVQLLIKNQEHLFPFQGEDVSMGIWTSPFNPKRVQDNRWLCSSKDLGVKSQDFISVPDVNEEDMHQLNNFKSTLK